MLESLVIINNDGVGRIEEKKVGIPSSFETLIEPGIPGPTIGGNLIF